MISYGKYEYIPALKIMWHKIFGDSESYLNSFFGKVYKDENTLVDIENGNVVSVLFMIPYKFIANGKETKIVYLYALATEPAYRGRKIMAKLIQKSLDLSAKRGYALSVLIPADDSLFEYYRQFGYEEYFERAMITKTIADIDKEQTNKEQTNKGFKIQEIGNTPMKLVKADAEQIWAAYSHSEIFASEGIILSKEQNEYYIEELKSEGGQAYVFKMSGDKDGYALLQLRDNNLLVLETNVDANNLKLFYEALYRLYKFEAVTFYQPICFDEAEIKPYKKSFAMAKSLNGINVKDPFINRVLM